MEVLREQFAVAAVSSREYTGVGFCTHFTIPDIARRLAFARRVVIGDVYADVAGLQHGAGFLIFVEHGMLDMLECFIVEDAWPGQACIRRLYYLHPKELGSPSLVEAVQRDLVFALKEAAVWSRNLADGAGC